MLQRQSRDRKIARKTQPLGVDRIAALACRYLTRPMASLIQLCDQRAASSCRPNALGTRRPVLQARNRRASCAGPCTGVLDGVAYRLTRNCSYNRELSSPNRYIPQARGPRGLPGSRPIASTDPTFFWPPSRILSVQRSQTTAYQMWGYDRRSSGIEPCAHTIVQKATRCMHDICALITAPKRRRKFLSHELRSIDGEIAHIRFAIEWELSEEQAAPVLTIAYWRQRLLDLLTGRSLLAHQREAIFGLLKRIEQYDDI
ncbi:hypothetical protein AWB72_05642 [Caballeronia concitans]|uniref:Uncharacterized protein n=2 Tax=Caballeronia concitans TaxID=1777133 RepID=A0A658R602_9BURK|nr:hypothetical protein AWB72_05642 [Caballeronia concitans]